MAAKVDQTTSETRRVQATGSMSTSSTVSANSPKISMFGAKSGFVIPKNKLSGSLVPIFRGGGKLEGANSAKEETSKQVQRKTKWGSDLTLDAGVKKGRALAYQTRLEQITQQLKHGALETKDNQSPLSTKQDLDNDSASHRGDKESSKLQQLELEGREIIGEILRLNPSYKPPADYKPLLKEADVRIPIKAHPGYNFIGLLLGPESNTQKRLEEETGAKVRVYGTKKDTGEKHEITHSDKNEAKDAYQELHVNISADTYDKVDAAVALIELLFTPVSGSAAVASTSSTSLVASNVDNADMNLKEATMATSDVNQGIAQPLMVTAQPSPLQFHFQPFPAPWPPIVPPNVQSHPSHGFMPSLSSNSNRFPSPISPFGAISFGGLPPPFSSTQRSPAAVASGPQLSIQGTQQPLNQAPPPINHTGQQPAPAYPTMLTTMPSFAAPRPIPSSAMPASSHVVSLSPHPVRTAPASLPNRPLTTLPPAGNSGWSTAAQIVPLAQRPTLLPSSAPLMRPILSGSSPAVASGPNMPSSLVSGPPSAISSISSQPNMPTNEANRPLATNFAPLAAFPSRPSASPFTSFMQTGSVSTPGMAPLSSGAPLPIPMPSSTPVPPNMPSPTPRAVPLLSGLSAAVPGPPAVLQSAALLGGSNPAMTQATAPPQPMVTTMGRPQLPPSQALAESRRPAQPLGSLPQLVPATPVSIPGGMPSFPTATQPPNTVITTPVIAAPKPPRPISGDFTFQPLGAQVPASPTPPRHSIQSVPIAVPQPPSFRPAMQSPSSVNAQGFPRPLLVNQTNPSQAPIRPPPPVAPFSVDPRMARPPPSLPANSIRIMGPSSQMVPSFPSAPQSPNLPSMSSQSAPFIQASQNHLHPANRPNSPAIPIQQLGGKPPGYMGGGVISSNAGGSQIYDPFSPTSVSSTPRKAEDNRMNVRKPETDAEYEDLMASVGVK